MNGLKVTKVRECALRGCCHMACWPSRMRAGLRDERGQGTTEYAILVGVLVVIAILAIAVFRPKLQELWDAIASGINGL
ncbi:Flp family type IVb pilin [Gordonibacter sp.]|uniref:Flp family type IVb pilin n=1 Tax=Gordonibacter sp. TaxID=1968902 RepID=UPI002FC74CB2